MIRTKNHDVVPIGQKVAFGSGHLANQLFPAALGVFMIVLVLALKMDPLLAGLLASLPRLLDALTDPIMGYISDNTKSRWGRRKPYIFLGAVITGVSFMAMWQLYPENSQTYNFYYFLILSLLFYIGYTIFATPLIGLGYEMTPDYHERTRLMGVSQFMGQMAWMLAPWAWVLIYNQDLYPSAPEGARNLAIWVGGLCIVLGMMPAFFCKEIPQSSIVNQAKLSLKAMYGNFVDLFRSVVKAFSNRPFLKLCAATFLVFNGFQTIAGFSFYIIIFYLYNGDDQLAGHWPAWFGTVSAFATAFLVIPVITRWSVKWGKKNAFIVATLISIVGYALKWWGFHPGNPYLMFLPIPFMCFGIGGLFTLMMSMTADVCDLDELKNGMPRREGLFGAVYWWMVKLGNAIALLISGAVLKYVGFDQNVTQQTVETMTQLRIADIAIPAISAALAVVVMWHYNITEKVANEIRQKLVKRRGELSST
ncbi:MAG: MFS transporter [Flavobacteriaceae bacterium]|nr:MFS transporter [Flavobacteriaceae bacterium]